MSAPNPIEGHPGWIGKLLKSPSNRFILGIVVVLLMIRACNPNVNWEEEVLLNTGETIIVKRSGSYSFGYSGAVGFIGFSPEPKSTIKFEYKGKRYEHTDDVGLILLAISPEGKPTLVTSPQNTDWQWRHDYLCAMPSYVQLQFDELVNAWVWPPQIEYWLYRQPTNLALGRAELAEDGQRFSAAQVKNKNASAYGAGPQFQFVDPTFQSTACKRSR